MTRIDDQSDLLSSADADGIIPSGMISSGALSSGALSLASGDSTVVGQKFPMASLEAVSPDAAILTRVCDPLFQFICRLNRMKRMPAGQARLDSELVRDELIQLLEKIQVAAQSQGCAIQYSQLDEPLRCFADIVMMRGEFPFSKNWQIISGANDPDTILIRAAQAAERDASSGSMMILYTCLCLSFDLLHTPPGDYSTLDLIGRIDNTLRGEDTSLFCPAAYQGVFTRSILPPLSGRLRLLAAGSAALVLLAIAGAVLLNIKYYHSFSTSLQSVKDKVSPAAVKR